MTPMSIHRNIGIEKDVDPSKHRDRKRCRSIETSGSKKMSIHRNIGIEKDVDPSKHRDRNGLVQSKGSVIQGQCLAVDEPALPRM
jgi:hypothetical protein